MHNTGAAYLRETWIDICEFPLRDASIFCSCSGPYMWNADHHPVSFGVPENLFSQVSFYLEQFTD